MYSMWIFRARKGLLSKPFAWRAMRCPTRLSTQSQIGAAWSRAGLKVPDESRSNDVLVFLQQGAATN